MSGKRAGQDGDVVVEDGHEVRTLDLGQADAGVPHRVDAVAVVGRVEHDGLDLVAGQDLEQRLELRWAEAGRDDGGDHAGSHTGATPAG